MADARSAWNDAGQRLTELGQKLKTHYEQQHGTEGPQTREELAEAAKRVGGAVQDAFEAIGAAAKDKSVQAEVKQVGQSLYDALGVTFGQVSEDLRRSLSLSKGEAAARQKAAGEGSTSVYDVPPVYDVPATTEAPTTEATGAGSATSSSPTSSEPAAPGEENPPKIEPWGTP